jgi:uncharacterized protein YbaR (Trm112 family)
MPVSQELLDILVCPETKQPVHVAPPEVLAAVNERIATGTLRNRGGDLVPERVAEGLVREDGKILYVVDDSIPVMLVEESIELD